MIKPKICTVVTGKTIEEFLKNLDDAQKVSEFIELRVDYLEGISTNLVSKIFDEVYKKVIFTCRSKKYSGKGNFVGDRKLLLDIVDTADELSADYIDMDISEIEELGEIDLKNSKLIVSYHNFIETPKFKVLEEVLENLRSKNPFVAKIATMANKYEDVLRLSKLLSTRKLEENLVIIGMGEVGRVSRIVFPLLGSFLTYASIEGKGSAPGQIDVGEMKMILSKIIKDK